MATIIFVCEKTTISSSFVSEIQAAFDSTVMPFQAKKILGQMEKHHTDLIAVYLRDMLVESAQELDALLKELKSVPLLFIGSERLCEEFRGKTEAPVKTCIVTPLTLSDFITQFKDVVAEIDPKAVATAEKALAKSQNVHQRHVLVVDDDPLYLRTTMNWLKGNYHVSLVKTGLDALAFLDNEKPDVILLDYEMPGWNGAETLKKIRESGRNDDIPVIFLTGVSTSSVVKDVVSLKPQGYLLKTVDRAALLEKIAEVIQEAAK